jgi:Asp-tRNA(Asn)/Glu-tRNA(Gln) amidotransferase B subunit
MDNKNVPGLDEDQLLSITFTNVEQDGVKCKIMSEETYNNLMAELKKLRHHYDHTVNLWATDKTPDELVDLIDSIDNVEGSEPILKEFLFQIK